MDPKPEKTTTKIVELAISDEEDETGAANHAPKTSAEKQSHIVSGVSAGGSVQQDPTMESRSFWKAGGYDVGFSKSAFEGVQLEYARVHPKFLHSNATSHKWAFGAIAELLDNAIDEICSGATFVKVDKIYNERHNSPALLFQDNGGGMDPECIRQCMSLGYSTKKTNTTIGQYGNGFKTSTMRLGADVIVFSRTTRGSRATESIGLLSYTFLRRTGQDDVIVPMVDFELSESRAEPMIQGSLDDWSDNLNIILEWSPFASKEELMQQFEDIGTHGTKIIIYNLWLNDDGILELDFDHDEEDICLRDESNHGKVSKKHDRLVESHISYQIRYSLRAYASVLYLRKFSNFHIILRGKPVQQYDIADELKFSKVIMYKPQLGRFSKEVSVETRIGFVKEAPLLGVSGFNVYHKNRLIRPFWKVTPDGASRGNGVVGVLEANFVEPAHDKQDFERSALFIRLEMRLRQMILDFWKTHCHLIGILSPFPEMRNMQKENLDDQPVVGLSTDMQMHRDQPVIGLAANFQESIHNAQPVISSSSNSQKNFPSAPTIIGLAAVGRIETNAKSTWNPMAGIGENGSCDEGASVNCAGSAEIDKICEENVQLFMRCEEHRQKEMDLRQTIEDLEKELEDTKRKCSQLASHLESQRRQKMTRQQTEKAL